jgi:hypothetical protein
MSSTNTSQLLALLAIQPGEISEKVHDVQSKSDILKLLGHPDGLKAASLKDICTKAGIEGKSSVYRLAEVQAKVSNDQVTQKAVTAAAMRISENLKAAFTKMAAQGKIKPTAKKTDAAEKAKPVADADAKMAKKTDAAEKAKPVVSPPAAKLKANKDHLFMSAKLLNIDCTDLKTGTGCLKEINNKLDKDEKSLNKALLGAVLHEACIGYMKDDVSTMLAALVKASSSK